MKGIRLIPRGGVDLGPPLSREEIEVAIAAAERSPWCRQTRRNGEPVFYSGGEAFVNVDAPRGAGVGGSALSAALRSQAEAARDRAVEAVTALRSGETARIREWLARNIVTGDYCGVESYGRVIPGRVVEVRSEDVLVSYADDFPAIESFSRIDGFATGGTNDLAWNLRIIPRELPRAAAAFARETIAGLQGSLATAARRCADESKLRAALDLLTGGKP